MLSWLGYFFEYIGDETYRRFWFCSVICWIALFTYAHHFAQDDTYTLWKYEYGVAYEVIQKRKAKGYCEWRVQRICLWY